ncbi:MAG: glycosyltransferase [Acidobacteriota bacterium]|nr:glycosyltransferase [Acidobacteriota bacterium]
MITGRDIICIASIEWDFLWQGHQEINLRLARAGNRVLYIENTGVRSPGLKDARRVLKRVKRWTSSLSSGGVREVAPNIYVCSPLVLPPFGPHWQRRVNRQLLLPLVRRTAQRLGMKDALLWTYLPTDTAADMINLLRTPRSVTIYYCIADFSQLTPHARELRASEQTVARLSDVVFAQGPELAAHCVQWNENVHIFPFGVNLDAFPLEQTNGNHAASAPQSGSMPAALRSLPRPFIGYIGGLHRHVDFGLLIAMARARPQWSWILVGALQTDVGELSSLPNVYLLGQQPHPDLAHYVRAFDVCIVPYVDSLYTATVVPTKINEYLAVGKPVVSTGLPAVREFNEQHDILFTSTNQPDHFLEEIERALRSPADEATMKRRREVASLGDWERRVEAMSELIELEIRKKDRS